MTERKTLRIPEEDFEELEADKPDGVTWGYYLTKIRTVDK